MPTVATNGINLYYEEVGAGPPLVCIMGITAPGSVWAPHVDQWQRHFRCLAVDNRGVGRSDMPPGPYTTAMMADDYAGLLNSLGLSGVPVAGCSMGSTIAQQLALRHPALVKSLVLMCPWARCDRYATAIFEHMQHIKARLTPAEFMEYIQILIFAKAHWDDDAGYRDLVEGRRLAAEAPLQQPLFALEAQAAACIAHNVLAELGRIACPTLVIGGREDIFTPVWMAEEVASGIPGAELYLYEGAGHAFHFERVADFNARVVEWIQSH